MAVAQVPFLALVLLIVSSGLHCTSTLPACPEFCTCQGAPLLNCSSSGLSLVPQHIQDSVTELDLSHNLLDFVTLRQPHHNLRIVRLGNNSITHLSLCIERAPRSQYVRGGRLHRLRPRSRGCVSWAPTLQLLSVERNQLVQLPEGLEGSESLQVLQLSFNRISTLQPGVLSNLRQLKELDLQHNLITSLHPQMFQDLAQLTVLDLSFNMLTSIHPLMYLSLRNIGADVSLGGNRWECDCSMHSLRRRMAYDSSRSLQTWSIVCASPSILSGRDLLQVEENDLNCFNTKKRPELHQDVTVHRGSEILLSCATEDSFWLMPNGQASVRQPQAGLLIRNITEKDTGLYVCVSKEHEVVSVFNLHISRTEETRRNPRSLSRTSQEIVAQGTLLNRGQERNQTAPQSDLTLAVCLSVFITFLIAFILGVLARPLIDIVWRKITKKKSSSTTNSISSVEQRQYDNEAYSNVEELEETGTHRERRVTFSTVDFKEEQYYDTVYNDSVMEHEAAEAEKDRHTAEDLGSENSLQQNSPEGNRRDGSDHTHNMEYEHIPEVVELEERRRKSLSSQSDSSLSDEESKEDQMTQGHHTTPKTPQLEEDYFQQRADSSTARDVEVPQFSKGGTIETPGFSSEPFVDWSPHADTTNLTDPELWQENGELFEFSDSVRSTSARSSSLFGSFNHSKLIVVPTSHKQKRGDMSSSSSSSSSYVSEDEPSHYTVNSDPGEKKEKEKNYTEPEVSFEQQIHDVDSFRPSVGLNNVDSRHDIKNPAMRPDHSSSSDSSDTDGESMHNTIKKETDKDEEEEKSITGSDKPSSKVVKEERDTNQKVKPLPRTKFRDLSLGVMSLSKSVDIGVPSTPAAYSSSSSSESEAEFTNLKVEHNKSRVNDGIEFNERETLSTQLDHQYIPKDKRRLDVKAPSPRPHSSSSSDSEDETTGYIEKQRPGKVNIAGLPSQESQTVSHDPETTWPALDLEHIPRISRRLDIKAPSPASDSSSSSDSEDEATGYIEKQRPGKVNIAGLPSQESHIKSHDPERRWPLLDLEHTTRIKRRIDIKAQSPASDSSSSSDSEDANTDHIKKHEQGGTYKARPHITVSQTVSHDPEKNWPTLDLEHIPRITRRLDIKAPSPASDSSSSSDSEDETKGYIEKQRPGKVNIAGLPSQDSQRESHDPERKWPLLDLDHSTRIKRRLDIKAQSPASDSSSSSDSEDETTNHIKKQEQGETYIARPHIKVSQTVSHDPETKWATLDLEHIPRVTRRLDIKAPSPASDSSSSSENEDETKGYIEKQRPGKVNIAGLPSQESQTKSHDPERRWPLLDLDHSTRIKRRLDIKAQSPASDSSSSSDSEDETTNHIKKQEQGETYIASPHIKVSQTVSHNPETKWATLDLEHIPRVARRLDIKAPSPASDSSSSSDSEDETKCYIERQRPGKVNTAGLPSQESQTKSHDPERRGPLLDLEHSTRIKRRLDIKAQSPASDSLSIGVSQGSLQTESNSSTSDSDDENRKQNTKVSMGASTVSKTTEKKFTQSLKTQERSILHKPKTDHNIKLEKYTVTTDDMTTPEINSELQERWATMNLGFSRFRKRLEITSHTDGQPNLPSSPPPDSPSSSSSESGRERKTSRPKQKGVIPGIIPTESSLTPKNKPVNVSLSLKGRDDNSVEVDNRLRIDYSLPTTKEKSNQDTALAGVGTPHDRRYLDIKVNDKAPVKPPQRLSDSSSSSENEAKSTEHAGKGWRESQDRSSLYVAQAVDIKLDLTRSKTADVEKARTELESQTSKVGKESDSWHHQSLTNVPHINRDLNIRAQRESSSSSSEETMDQSVPNLSHGIPRVKRRLNIKAPSPQPSNSPSSCSDNENEVIGYTAKQKYSSHASNLSGMTDNDSLITYKRLIIKSSSLPSDSFSSSGKAQTTDHTRQRYTGAEMVTGSSHSVGDSNAPLAPGRVPNMSFGAMVKKKVRQVRHTTDVDLPPEIRWKGHLSDLSISSPRRHMDVIVSSPQQAPPSKPEPDSSDSSSSETDDEVKQERRKADATPIHEYSSLSPSSVSLSSGRALGKLDNLSSNTNEIWRVVSEKREERKGLNALKAMSSERQMWDTEHKNLDMGTSPLCDDQRQQGDISSYHHRSEEYIKPLAKQSKLLFSSTSVHERKAEDRLYGIPSYRRHAAVAIAPPQELPPPIPATPLPEEAADLSWRSQQNSNKQGRESTRFNLQQQRSMGQADPSSPISENQTDYFDSPNANISSV
ncbi:uncharacterized protein LOC122988751 [Scomber scombrus]|uniref:Uncharacterized protein LOC122988751 n=1 Tax=Scomber scombrus TaxID=13677 RepID=A0AAV1NAJ1_SCOSC